MEVKEIEHYTWADKIAAQLRDRSVKKHVVHGMWTPSGYFHIGNARAELMTPMLVHDALRDAHVPAEFNFFIDDFDDLDKIPGNIKVPAGFEKNLGHPLYEVPSPVPGFKSWSDYFSREVLDAMDHYGTKPRIYSSYEEYHKGTYDNAVRIVLNNWQKARDVWVKVTKTQKPADWIPVMAVCENCRRASTTVAMSWDREKLRYSCTQNRPYAQACGYEGEMVPEKGRVKLPWRLHWPATWFTFGVTFESGGKDHFAAGGSVESGHVFMREVFGQEPPLQIGVEFVQIDGKKISGSIGNTVSLAQWMQFAQPELLRFLYISYQSGTVINIDVRSQKFFLMTDRYDEAERCYYGQQSLTEKRTEQLKRIYEISQTKKLGKEMPLQVPFSTLVMLSQVIPDISAKKVFAMLQKMGSLKSERLSGEDEKRLERKIKFARVWVNDYAGDDTKIKVNEEAPPAAISTLEENERKALRALKKDLASAEKEEDLQTKIYDAARSHSVEPKKFFKILYNILINKDAGPRLAPFMLVIGREKVKNLLSEV